MKRFRQWLRNLFRDERVEQAQARLDHDTASIDEAARRIDEHTSIMEVQVHDVNHISEKVIGLLHGRKS